MVFFNFNKKVILFDYYLIYVLLTIFNNPKMLKDLQLIKIFVSISKSFD